MQAQQLMTCGTCGRTWDDSIPTSWTPVPSGRCPFEYFHDGEPIPADFPVQPLDTASSASRQHYIDTGAYLTREEAAEAARFDCAGCGTTHSEPGCD